MSVAAVKKKREERLSQIAAFNKKIEDIKANNQFSSEYKESQIKALNQEKIQLVAQYDQSINQLLAETKNHFIKQIDEAQFRPGEESRLLLIEMKNQQLAEDLYSQYKHIGVGDFNSDGGKLLEDARYAVEHNLTNAGAYVSALKRLGHNEATQLAQSLEIKNRTPLQNAYYRELEDLQKEEKAYQVDVVSESDPLKAALMEVYHQNQN